MSGDRLVSADELVIAGEVRRSADEQLRALIDEMDFMCVGCGCSKLRPCPGGCAWVAYEEASGVGICSQCATKPMDELLEQARRIFSA